MTLRYIWMSFQSRFSFPRPFQLSLACFRVARSPSNSWASCCSLPVLSGTIKKREFFVPVTIKKWLESYPGWSDLVTHRKKRLHCDEHCRKSLSKLKKKICIPWIILLNSNTILYLLLVSMGPKWLQNTVLVLVVFTRFSNFSSLKLFHFATDLN